MGTGAVVAENMAKIDEVKAGDDGRVSGTEQLTAEEQALIYERRAKRLRGEGLTAAERCPHCGSTTHVKTCKPAPHEVGFADRSETGRVTQ